MAIFRKNVPGIIFTCNSTHLEVPPSPPHPPIPGLESPLLFAVPFSDLLSDLAPASDGASGGGGTLSGGAAALSLPRPSAGGPSPCVDGAPIAGSPKKEN